MTEIVKLVLEVPKEVAEKYNGKQIEFFTRGMKAEYGKFIKAVAQILDPAKDNDLGQLRPNVADPNVIANLFPRLGKVFGVLQNMQIMNVLNLAMAAANLAATMKGFQEINERLDRIEAQLSEVKKEVDKVQKTQFEMEIAKPCRSLVSKYKDLSALYQEGKPIPEKDVITLLDESKEYIISMYNLRNEYSMQVALRIIFMMFPVFANCILIYYHRFYDPDKQKHTRHGEWMEVFDLLSDYQFIDEIQDDLFIHQRKTNKEVNEYLDCQCVIVSGYKQKIEGLLNDLKTCGSAETYDEAMRWSRQYAAQQAKSVQEDLAKQIGAERAKEIVEQAMMETAII